MISDTYMIAVMGGVEYMDGSTGDRPFCEVLGLILGFESGRNRKVFRGGGCCTCELDGILSVVSECFRTFQLVH